jgi:hypothetical protein
VTDSAIATEIHQTLDVHRNFTAQIAFNFELRNRSSEVRNLWLSEIFHY